MPLTTAINTASSVCRESESTARGHVPAKSNLEPAAGPIVADTVSHIIGKFYILSDGMTIHYRDLAFTPRAGSAASNNFASQTRVAGNLAEAGK